MKSLERLAGQEGVAFLDLTEPLSEAVAKDGFGTYYIEGDGHWAPKGHALAADLITDLLVQQNVPLRK